LFTDQQGINAIGLVQNPICLHNVLQSSLLRRSSSGSTPWSLRRAIALKEKKHRDRPQA